MLLGYARASTVDQTLMLQQDVLKAGCERIFTDTASGSHVVRPGLDEALGFVRPGDTLSSGGWTGWAARCATSSTPSPFQERGIGFKSLQEQIDTTTSGGRLVFHVFSALGECEPDVIRERTHAGASSPRLGEARRTPQSTRPRTVQIAHALYHGKTTSSADICRTLRISRATLYHYIYITTGTGGLT